MGTLLLIIGVGFLLGMRHATDPDHVIAVTTIVARQRSFRHAMFIGAIWGVGHTLTIFFVGCAIILFGVAIPPRIGLSMELCVGLMLILLGILNLTGVTRWITRRFSVNGSPAVAAHTHTVTADPSEEAAPDRKYGGLGSFHAIRPLLVGIVHGMAGSAAVALLVLAAIPKPSWGMVYLLIFGVGTIAGMTLITAAIAVPYVHTFGRFARLNEALTLGSGLLSLAFGAFIAYEIGIVDGLFTKHPNWTPH
jgi:ABC-type nickel/cobalt efflux system permease component RcnA